MVHILCEKKLDKTWATVRGKKDQQKKKTLQNHHLVYDHVAARASLVFLGFFLFGWSGQFKVEQL